MIGNSMIVYHLFTGNVITQLLKLGAPLCVLLINSIVLSY
jgi:hypothetical protein